MEGCDWLKGHGIWVGRYEGECQWWCGVVVWCTAIRFNFGLEDLLWWATASIFFGALVKDQMLLGHQLLIRKFSSSDRTYSISLAIVTKVNGQTRV